LTDSSDALTSFQQALLDGEIQLRRDDLDPKLFVHHDSPQGKMRLTYARLDGQTVTALALVVMGDPIEGLPCFELGVAVPEEYRRQGRAKKIVEAAIAELKHGLARNKIPTFYVEAIVGTTSRNPLDLNPWRLRWGDSCVHADQPNRCRSQGRSSRDCR
jgi:hypothetical protein